MIPIIRAARGGLGGRRLQAVIVGLVVLAATAASTLALGMLSDAHSPFDHAFAAQHGADVAADVDTSAATPAQLAATTRLAGVTAAAGPFATVSVIAGITIPGVSGSSSNPLQITGRSSPGGPVDDLTLDSGHWPASDDEIVLSRTAPGDLGSTITIGSRKLTVVGIADSVTNTAQAWVLPSGITALSSGPSASASAGPAQMLYRFSGAGTSSAVAADIAAVRAALPHGALLNTTSYLDVRQSEQSAIAPWVPFIIAFGVIALVISVLIVVNVVSGAVIAGTTRIGVLKSIGFTPVQVVFSYVLLVAVPAVAGCVAGAVCGNLLAVPLLSQNAQVYQVGVLGIPLWVDVTVPLAVLALTAAGAVPPALRAGRMSAVQAIATGRAPRPSHGYVAQRGLAKLGSVPRAVTLGLAAPFARPARTLVTVVAIVFGAAAVTFGAGLGTSLNRAYSEISQNTALPVQVLSVTPGLPPGLVPGKPPAGGRKIRVAGATALTAAQQRTITSALASQPGTLHYLVETHDQLSPPGLAGTVNVTAYDGDPSWTGFGLISGRWFSSGSAPAEVVVNTLFLTDTGTSVGSTYTLVSGGHRATVRIVGEVFRPGNDLDLYLSPATLALVDPAAGPQQYDVALRPGTSPQAYANAVSASLGNSYDVSTAGGGGKELIAVVTLVAMLTILIMVVAGLGVLNTVALQIRERAHDIGVFKAVGMTPRQTLAMVVCSVGFVGLIAGIMAVPAGVYLHHGVVPTMAHAANSGTPPALLSVYVPWELVLLALAGLLIAVAGALGPAGWAARTRTAFALRAE
ncbi:MAG: ABC transporter permease [Streptosporangiaceae bacterium]|nr:ABC transporter permease [Streptosporangiaceae bacterium]